MGYFANLYIVEVSASETTAQMRTTIYGNDIGPVAYFCWGPGDRPEGLHSYAGGTVFCDSELKLLPGYPLDETFDDANQGLISANFTPRHRDDPVLFHFVLPERFIPRRDMKPLEQPVRPFVYTADQRIVATYPVIGAGRIQFWVTRLKQTETISDYEVHKFLHPEEEHPLKMGFEFNVGVFKLKFG